MTTDPRPITIIESPFSASSRDQFRMNMLYLKAAGLDCMQRGETFWCSHGFYPQFLHDAEPEERLSGLSMGFQLGQLLIDAILGQAARARMQREFDSEAQADLFMQAYIDNRILHGIYTDLGISPGMRKGMDAYRFIRQEERELGMGWKRSLKGRDSMRHLATSDADRDLMSRIRAMITPGTSNEQLGADVRRLLIQGT